MVSLGSLPPICVALGAHDPSKLQKLALASLDSGEEFLELRLDLLPAPAAGVNVIRRVRRRYPEALLLATCRLKENGGGMKGSVQQQLHVLKDAIGAGADLVDVEIETAELAEKDLESFGGETRLVISYHNFEKTPALGPVMRRLIKIPADIYKVATLARKPSDGLRLLELPNAWPAKKLVVLGMGEVAAPTRILGPARNSAFVFSSPDSPESRDLGEEAEAGFPTAPGQIPASLLRTRYQCHRWNSSTKVYGVMACPVAHSMSPALHNRAFRARRVSAVYVPFLVEPNYLTDFFKVVKQLPVAGLSVTIPHKQRVIRHLDGVDTLARRIGAVNTIYRKGGKLWGTNTDTAGVVVPLSKRLKLNRASALVVGNGGAARGAVFALLDEGAKVTVTGRNPARVQALARACEVSWVARERLSGQNFDLLIQATPLGMHPKVEGCFFSDEIPAELVFDMVYNPLETALLQRARQAGKKTISGLEMFVEQAAAQFELWTRESAPRSAMKSAVLEALSCP